MIFEKTYLRLLMEAGEPPETDGAQPPSPDLNLPELSELEGDAPNQDAGGEAKPEEYELAKLAIKTLEAAGGIRLNPKIFDDFESGGNIYAILNYVEKAVNSKSGSDEFDSDKLYQKLEIPEMKGMSIGQKMHYYQRGSVPSELQLDAQRRKGWVRIILNAARHGYRDFMIDFEVNRMTGLELESLYQQLAIDLSFDTRGSDYDVPDKI